MNIGEKISSKRKALGLTLEEVGNAVGVGKSTVLKWENGYISNMRRDKIALLARVLKMNPTELIEDDGNISKTEKRSEEHFSADELSIIEAYRNLNDEGKEKIRDYISDIVVGGRYKKDTAAGLVQEA